MRTRRPNLLAYNDWIKECVRTLSRSPHESDKRYASWFGLQIITDEALSSFGLDDTSSTAVLSETRVNGVLRLFDKKMDDWKEDIDEEFLTGEYQMRLLLFPSKSKSCRNMLDSLDAARVSIHTTSGLRTRHR